MLEKAFLELPLTWTSSRTREVCVYIFTVDRQRPQISVTVLLNAIMSRTLVATTSFPGSPFCERSNVRDIQSHRCLRSLMTSDDVAVAKAKGFLFPRKNSDSAPVLIGRRRRRRLEIGVAKGP